MESSHPHSTYSIRFDMQVHTSPGFIWWAFMWVMKLLHNRAHYLCKQKKKTHTHWIIVPLLAPLWMLIEFVCVCVCFLTATFLWGCYEGHSWANRAFTEHSMLQESQSSQSDTFQQLPRQPACFSFFPPVWLGKGSLCLPNEAARKTTCCHVDQPRPLLTMPAGKSTNERNPNVTFQINNNSE